MKSGGNKVSLNCWFIGPGFSGVPSIDDGEGAMFEFEAPLVVGFGPWFVGAPGPGVGGAVLLAFGV